jgi:peptide/nickel transport system permease protein
MAVAGGIALSMMMLLAILASVIAPYQFDVLDLDNMKSPPSRLHLFGTDDLGRDQFTRALYGARVSLSIGVFSALVSASVGTLMGSTAGYFGGRIDGLIMRFTDIVFSVPLTPLVIILSAILKPSVPMLVMLIGGLGWMATARIVRGVVLSIRNLEYITAAHAQGASDWAIIVRHVLPNAAAPIIVAATLSVGGAIISESVLSFLGLGVQPPVPSWGNMLQGAQSTMESKPWLAIFPGLLILITVLSVNFLGDGLRDALDPRLKDR